MMTMKIDDEEYVELMESAIAMIDGARHEANVGIARGEQVAAVALNLAQRLSDTVRFMQQHFPSQWRIETD